MVIDIGLPETNGVELIKRIHAQDKTLPMLALSMHDEALYAETRNAVTELRRSVEKISPSSAAAAMTWPTETATPPTVMSIARQSPAGQATNGTSVVYRVTFIEVDGPHGLAIQPRVEEIPWIL